MSYDFHLFKRKAGEDPLVTARADSDAFPTTPPDPQKEALSRKVADALIAHNPELEVFQFDYDEIARHEKISVEQARLKYRHLELNGSAENFGEIQITLFDDEASVTVPFWHEGDKAADTFREIWSYLEILSREAGYLIYDPQIDRVIEPSASFDDALACYSGAMRQIRQSPPPGSERKPWWKFW
jgi:hypothetical protein